MIASYKTPSCTFNIPVQVNESNEIFCSNIMPADASEEFESDHNNAAAFDDYMHNGEAGLLHETEMNFPYNEHSNY